MIKKFIYTFILIITIAYFPIKSINAFGLNQAVPVLDSTAIKTLGKILETNGKIIEILNTMFQTFTNEFQRSNSTLLKILETQFHKLSDNIASDALKAEQYKRIVIELDSFIQARQQKAQDTQQVRMALDEARAAGSYIALKKIKESLNCLNPRIRNEFQSYLKEKSEEFYMEYLAEDIISSTQDCEIAPLTTTAKLKKQSLFAWLLQPFQLAQVQGPTNQTDINPSFVIEPALQESKDTVEIINLKNFSDSIINEKVQEKEKERKKQIGEIWPVEVCEQFADDINADPVCLKWKTVISSNDLLTYKANLQVTNPLKNSASNPFIFQTLEKPTEILSQTGLIYPTYESAAEETKNLLAFNTSTDFTSLPDNKNVIEEIITSTCESYKAGEPKNSSSSDPDVAVAYALCGLKITRQFEIISEIKEKQIEQEKERAKNTRDFIEKLQQEASETLEALNKCKNIPKRYAIVLSTIFANNDSLLKKYQNFVDELNNFHRQLKNHKRELKDHQKDMTQHVDSAIKSIASIQSQLGNVITDLGQFGSDINEFLNDLGISIDFGPVQTLFGKLKGAFEDISTMIGNVTKGIQGLMSNIQAQINEFMNKFNEFLKPLESFIQTFNKINKNFLRDVSNARTLHNLYELDEYDKTIKNYKRILDTYNKMGRCQQ
jgi:NTP pyrophosphatase (non-canonical NTP hydrolase)